MKTMMTRQICMLSAMTMIMMNYLFFILEGHNDNDNSKKILTLKPITLTKIMK